MSSESKSLPYLLAKLDERLLNDNTATYPFGSGFVSDTLKKKLFILRLLIQNIHQDIYERKSLEQRVLEEMGQSIIGLHNQVLARQWLTDLLLYQGKSNPELTGLKIKETDVEVEKARIRERSLRDRIELKKEMRLLLREYLETIYHIQLFQ